MKISLSKVEIQIITEALGSYYFDKIKYAIKKRNNEQKACPDWWYEVKETLNRFNQIKEESDNAHT